MELQSHLKIMKQNCYRLIRLVNNIIDISKIESGYIEPDFHYDDIVAAVEDTTMSAADYIKSNGIELCFDTDIEEKFMCFDKDKIERVMLNLLSNAVKFSNPGSTITVELTDSNDSVTIRVKDTGIGIDKDSLNSIFERFVQVDKSLTRSQEGSGIGLSLVKSLVEMHKGTITVESEYGKGTTFIITLPTTLPETKKQECEKLNLQAAPVEKVNIEFSDI
jgi:signal transduction histidine kinase